MAIPETWPHVCGVSIARNCASRLVSCLIALLPGPYPRKRPTTAPPLRDESERHRLGDWGDVMLRGHGGELRALQNVARRVARVGDRDADGDRDHDLQRTGL